MWLIRGYILRKLKNRTVSLIVKEKSVIFFHCILVPYSIAMVRKVCSVLYIFVLVWLVSRDLALFCDQQIARKAPSVLSILGHRPEEYVLLSSSRFYFFLVYKNNRYLKPFLSCGPPVHSKNYWWYVPFGL